MEKQSDVAEVFSTDAESSHEQGEQVADNCKKGQHAKLTAFHLFEHFCSTVSCVDIDNQLCLFDYGAACYRPITQKTLESFLFEKYYTEVSQSGSMRMIKTCAELIFRYRFPQVVSAESQMILCLRNGYIPLVNMETTGFFLYNYAQYNPYPTYQINAQGFKTMVNWESAKSLPTPWMDQFISISASGIPRFRERIWEMLGYLISPDNNGKCFFVLQGVPNSGKSVLGRFLQALFPDYKIATLDIDQLGKRNSTSQLLNKSLNISMDLPNKALSPIAIRNIKLITGNDSLTTEHQDGSYAPYHGNCRFLFATNHSITLRGSDSGLEERIVCIPFTYSLLATERNPNLLHLLLTEANYIVAKALAYYRDLRNNGYVFFWKRIRAVQTSNSVFSYRS